MQSKVKQVRSGKLGELIERQKIQRFILGKLQLSIFYHGFAGKNTLWANGIFSELSSRSNND